MVGNPPSLDHMLAQTPLVSDNAGGLRLREFLPHRKPTIDEVRNNAQHPLRAFALQHAHTAWKFVGHDAAYLVREPCLDGQGIKATHYFITNGSADPEYGLDDYTAVIAWLAEHGHTVYDTGKYEATLVREEPGAPLMQKRVYTPLETGARKVA